MSYTTLIPLSILAQNYTNPNWVVIDCHFQLDNPDAGHQAYLKEHIPGASYAHLDKDLSGPILPGKTSRHPLPSVDTMTETLSNFGIDENTQVVVYDNRGGAIAVRLWWMLKWLGHDAAAVLDGKFDHWKQAGHPISDVVSKPTRKSFSPHPQPKLTASINEIETIRDHPEKILIDSRAPERYRGEVEPLDPVAGHIPGADNLYYLGNLDKNENMLPIPKLRSRFSSLTKHALAENLIFYCGSGVTSAHNILAMAHAGLGFARIYPGSWSEWITDPDHEIATSEK